ncbi:hypothetical protein QYF36_000027 [Acer negundo]|nr:hypothetical protein QYF36_000027 [Acer negundo]
MKYLKPLKLYQQWRKELTLLNKPNKGRLLGLYLENETVKVSSSHSSILGHAFYIDEWCRSNTNIHVKLLTLISKYNVTGLVINNPHLRNMDLPYRANPKVFIADLCKTGRFEGLKYTYWNSSFLSKYDDDFGESEVIYKGNLEAMPSRIDQKLWKMDRDHEMDLVCSFMLKGFIRCGVMTDGREKDFYFNT